MHIEITDNWDRWVELLPIDRRDIYYREMYVKRYRDEETIPLCLICNEDDRVLLMPFLRKTFDAYYDFETPYGYGGPISNSEDIAWCEKALNEAKIHFVENNYLCGFVRFHPMLHNEGICERNMQVIFDRKTVYIDTELDEEDIWKTQISSKNRNMIRKAEKNGLVYTIDVEFSCLDEFIGLYNSTMERLDAEEFYYFDNEYYKELVASCKENAFLGIIRKDDEIVCGAIFFYDGFYGHYHLEGSNHAFSSLGANNLLLWCTAKELHNRGVKKFHLGGGYDTTLDNSLLKFKKSFSPNLTDFYIGKWIFNKEAYSNVCHEWELQNPEKIEIYGNRLLKYRY